MNQPLPRWPWASRRVCLAAAAASLLGCAAHQTFTFGSPDLEAAFQRMKEKAPPKGRETIERLEQDDMVTIHFVKGRVSHFKSRGTETVFASSKEAKFACMMRHPSSIGIPWNRNFDIIYDEELAEQAWGFPNPMEPLFYHEVIGHADPVLDDPTLIRRPAVETEPYAIERENEYRQYNGIPLVPQKAVTPPAMSR